ncbi:MAG: diaminopimelate decarboxylase [Bdellovibrionia bacterium]
MSELNPAARARLSKLAKKYPTPFYAYDLALIRAQVRGLRSAMPKNTDIHYAMKANSNREILKCLRTAGTGVDTVSGGEIERARECGFTPSQILFSGVGKREDELQLAIRLKIKLINVESPQELVRLGMLADRMKKDVYVGFRLNPDIAGAGGHKYISTGGHANKFGMPFNMLPELKKILRSHPRLKLLATDFHIGSQLMKIAPFEQSLERTLPIFNELRAQGYPLRYFDVGGGLGIRYKDETPIGFRAYGAMVKKHLKKLDARILTEPGRVLVGEAGHLVTTVEYIKRGPGKFFAIVDTGMHHLIRPALYQAYHPIASLKSTKGAMKKYDIVGPICESSDVLAENRRLPEIEQGDFLVIGNAGAYGFSMASRYNLQPLPSELVF